MLARNNRITKKKDFDAVKSKGRTYYSDFFSITILKTPFAVPTRFGFIVSKTISPNASLRNKVRRALDEGVRQNLYALKEGYDCVIVAKPPIIKAYTADIIHKVKEALDKTEMAK